MKLTWKVAQAVKSRDFDLACGCSRRDIPSLESESQRMASPSPKCRDRQALWLSCQSLTRFRIGVFNSVVTLAKASLLLISWRASKESLENKRGEFSFSTRKPVSSSAGYLFSNIVRQMTSLTPGLLALSTLKLSRFQVAILTEDRPSNRLEKSLGVSGRGLATLSSSQISSSDIPELVSSLILENNVRGWIFGLICYSHKFWSSNKIRIRLSTTGEIKSTI